MRNTKVKKRYAKALFELAIEQNLVEEVYADMLFIDEVCRICPEFKFLMRSPIVKSDKKDKIIGEILPKTSTTLTKKFIHIITKKNRESFIDLIAIEFIELYKELHNIKTVYLSTSTSLNTETIEKIKVLISKELDSTIELKQTIDSKLIGGFIIKSGDKVFDSSLSGKIEKLKFEFSQNAYKKGF